MESGLSKPSTPNSGRLVLGRCAVLMRQLALSVLEILLSILLYSPELILGVLRMLRASWAQATGSANWKPQAGAEASRCWIRRVRSLEEALASYCKHI